MRRRKDSRSPILGASRHDSFRSTSGDGCGGFTLIEVLVTLAIIGVLVAILIPTATSVRRSADRARVKLQFAQWAAAVEGFRSEYGHYPQFDASHKVNGAAADAGLGGPHLFHDLLAGKQRDGQPLGSGSAAAAQNRRRIGFHSFGQSEFTDWESATPGLLHDALGNTDIVIMVDRNLDGRIDATDYAALPAVSRADGVLIGAPVLPVGGLPASVAFYSAAATATPTAPEFVLSWE